MLRVFMLGGLVLAACGGGAGTSLPAIEQPPAANPPVVSTAPQLPDVDGELIGFPGAEVPGLDAYYIWTGLGWLGPDDDVVFEAVIQWNENQTLGCGILRSSPSGKVNGILMQDDPLPGTGGGKVKHPKLPIESRGDTLIIPAQIEGGAFSHGLFAVNKRGGTPVLLAAGDEGAFTHAVLTDDGTAVAQVETKTAHAVIVVPPGEDPTEICASCEPGFSTDGTCVVVRHDDAAWMLTFDGMQTRILGIGDPAPGSSGAVTAILSARVTPGGDFVVHAQTDDPDRPDVLLRIDESGQTDVLAACGAPVPGGGVFAELHPAAGDGEDIVFGASVDLNPAMPEGVFAKHTVLAASGQRAAGLDGDLRISARDVVGGEAGQAAFGALVYRDSEPVAGGVFVRDAAGIRRVLTTGARLVPVDGATVAGFLFPLRVAIRFKPDGRTLVHVGIREERRPDATLGALLLVR